MSLDRGINNAFNMFLAMQRNRDARAADERNLAYKRQYDTRRLGQIDRELGQRDRALGIDETNAATQQGRLTLERGRLTLDQAIERRAAAQEARGLSQQGAMRLLGQGYDDGYVNPDTNRFTPEFFSALEAGDPRANKYLSDMQRRHPERYAEGFIPTNFDHSTAPGSVIARGTDGVVTRGATSDPNDRVAPIDKKLFNNGINNDLTDLVADAYGFQYLTLAANKGAAREALSREEANRAEEEAQAIARKTAADQMYQVGGIVAGRELEAIAASEQDPVKRRELFTQLAEDFGLELPEFTPEDQQPPELIGRDDEIVTPKVRPGQFYRPGTRGRIGGSQVAGVVALDNRIEKLAADADSAPNEKRRKFIEEELAETTADRDRMVRRLNKEKFEEVSTDLEKAKESLAGARPGRKPYWEREVQRLENQVAEFIKAGVDTPVTETDGWEQLEADVLTRIEGLSPQEVDDLVDRGLLKFTPETTAALRQRAQELDVNSVADFRRLPTREELAFRAITSVFAADPASRENARQEMDNLTETGSVSTSRQQQQTLANQNLTARASLLNAQANMAGEGRQTRTARTGRVDEAVEYAQGFMQNIDDALEGEEGIGARRAIRRFFPQAELELNKYKNDPESLTALYQGINAGVSRAFARVADSGLGGGLVDDFVSIFTPSTAGDPTDFDLANITINDAGNELRYRGPRGREQGSVVSVAALEQQFGKDAVDLLVAAANANRALMSARAVR